ncbi:MAG: OmpA family protein [Bacteroidetes bacterium]|nr:OmpA family protein [Bacteroidota bacterium]MBU1717909.1 OmpA family protein [Bacteroidota bacterium]
MKGNHWLPVLLVFCVCSGFSHTASAQLIIKTGIPPDSLVNSILLNNSDVIASEVEYTGGSQAIGFFENDSTNFPVSRGIILSTGNVHYAPGPNRSKRQSYIAGESGDKELMKLAKGATSDAAILSFDFIPQSDTLSFRYVFASEEYIEFTKSKYNDVFAFFISGPGFPEPLNLATIPGTNIPITVNNVNTEKNSRYFYRNEFWNKKGRVKKKFVKSGVIRNIPYTVEYDGFTTVLTAETQVIPGKTYHIRLAIADVNDNLYDSSVFLEAGSFKSHGNSAPLVAVDTVFPEIKEIIALPRRDSLVASVTKNIEFEYNSAEIRDTGIVLVEAIKVISMYDTTCVIEIVGHTDYVGSASYNEVLSEKRAKAVVSLLCRNGIEESRIKYIGMGESTPYKTVEPITITYKGEDYGFEAGLTFTEGYALAQSANMREAINYINRRSEIRIFSRQ